MFSWDDTAFITAWLEVRVLPGPPTLYKTGHSGSAAAGVQNAIRKAGVGTANFDFPVAYFDPADQVPHTNKHARAYFGILKLVIGDNEPRNTTPEAVVSAALSIENAVRTAVSEHSLNPQNIESAIRQALLPKLFELLGLDKAKDAIERVIAVTRIGISRGEF